MQCETKANITTLDAQRLSPGDIIISPKSS